MTFSLHIHKKRIYYNGFREGDPYHFPLPSVYHYVALGDPFDSVCSRERWEYRSLRYLFHKYRLRGIKRTWEDLLTKEIKMIFLPSAVFSDGIKPGSVQLRFVTKEMTFFAGDKYGDGTLYQQFGIYHGMDIGIVFYEYGIILIYNDVVLEPSVFFQDYYRSMVKKCGVPDDYDEGLYQPRWVYFGNIGNPDNSFACNDSYFYLGFDIRSDLYKRNIFIPTGVNNWSNSPVFYSRGGDVNFGDSFVEEVVEGAQLSGQGGQWIPKKSISFNSLSLFDDNLFKLGTVNFACPVFTSKNPVTVKVKLDF